jgi:hypothetical protein
VWCVLLGLLLMVDSAVGIVWGVMNLSASLPH